VHTAQREPATASHAGRDPIGPVAVAAMALLGLASVALAAARGSVAGIGYDGWWHLFVARQPTWRLFVDEVLANPHPPLYHLLLRATSELGSAPLVYRLVGLVAFAVSLGLVGRLALRVVRSEALVPLAVAALGTSVIAVDLAADLRSYTLAGAFWLAAVLAYLRLLAGAPGWGASVGLAAALLAGALSHYAVLFLVPLLPLVSLGLPGRPPGHFPKLLAALAPALVLGLAASLAHMAEFDAPSGYMPEHHFAGGSLLAYGLRTWGQEVALLAPVDLTGAPRWLLAVLGLVAVVAVPALAARWRRCDVEGSALLLLLAGLVAGTFVASLLGRYPFGGPARHQYFVLLLAVPAAVLLLDRGVGRLAAPRARRIAVAAIWGLVLAGAAWRHSELPPERWDDPVRSVERVAPLLPEGSPLLVRQASLVPLFAGFHDARWRYVGRVPETWTDEWRVDTGTTSRVVYRRLGGWLQRLDDPEVHRDVRVLFDRLGRVPAAPGRAHGITLLELRQRGAWRRPGPPWREQARRMAERARALARREGLAIEALQIERDHALAVFRPSGAPRR